MTDFETQCDCELDSPGALSHLPIEERLKHWTDWALYLKRRIEAHYRPAIAGYAAGALRLIESNTRLCERAEQAEAELATLKARDKELATMNDPGAPSIDRCSECGVMEDFGKLKAELAALKAENANLLDEIGRWRRGLLVNSCSAREDG
jgi:hypothetical protein